MAGLISPKSQIAAAVVALALAVAVPGVHPASAYGPDSVADLVAPLLDAVVNISTTQTVTGSDEDGPDMQLPEGSPFQDFFDQFFNHKDGSGDNTPDTRPRRVQSLGSGFVIDPSGLIVTNNHVIEGADEITVNFSDGRKLPATVKGRDEKTDIALIQVNSPKPLTAIKFGDSTVMRVGDWVMAIGNPFGLGGTVTAGIISARNRDINAGPYDDFFQTDAAINRGNSGGPLFNQKGEVIGINTAIISPTGGSIGIGFAIPSEIAANIVDQLRQVGEIRRGWLGVRIEDVPDDMAKQLAMDVPRGALVAGVEDKGPAAAAGILEGDVIVSVDGQQIDAGHALPRLVADEPVGKTVSVVLLRDGKEKTVDVTLGLLKETAPKTVVASAPPSDDKGATPASPPAVTGPLGLAVADLSPDTRSQYDIKSDVSGVVVTGVQQGSVAEDHRIEAGDVISMVGEVQVTNTDEFNAQVAAMKKDGRANVKLVVQSKEGHVRFVNVPLAD